jgi:hypothetical protein
MLLIIAVAGGLIFCAGALGCFACMQKRAAGPQTSRIDVMPAPSTGVEMSIPVVALPVTGGRTIDQIAKQPAASGIMHGAREPLTL